VDAVPDVDPRPGAETVLIVEDEPAVRQFATLVLKMHGYTVLEAGLGADAVRLVGEYTGPIHLLITDVSLPDTSGRVLAGQLGGTRPGLRVVYMSGYTADEFAENEGQDDGIVFLKKPFAVAELARTVRAALDHNGG
jgi:two-component system, cell cycle sensor histidine kinase and response regulator CckA